MLKIALLGATGRMGQEIARLTADQQDLELVGASCGDPTKFGTMLSFADIVLSDAERACRQAQVVLDFSVAEQVVSHVLLCHQKNLAYVSGVTAISDRDFGQMKQTSRHIPLLWAPNMSSSVNLCFSLVAQIARGFDTRAKVAIEDLHHASKKDTPSGTALEFGRIIKNTCETMDIDYHSIREGVNPGRHKITFTASGQTIALSHQASSRAEFAQGAIDAVRWLADQGPGLYSMQDVLNEKAVHSNTY